MISFTFMLSQLVVLYYAVINVASVDACIQPCENNPCLETQAGNCTTYTDNGCEECAAGLFKQHYWYPCVSCQETFGDSCMHCADFIGCDVCSPGHILTWDSSCEIWYCEDTPAPVPPPTSLPSDSPTEEPTSNPTQKCPITETDLRILFDNAEYDAEEDYWCYNYRLRILDEEKDNINLDDLLCVANNSEVTWFIDFNCDSVELGDYLESVTVTAPVADFVISDNIFHFSKPRDTAEDGDMYTLCFNNALGNNVEMIDTSEYCVNTDDVDLMACDSIIVPNLCGESSFYNNKVDSDLIAKYPISYVPVAGEHYSLDEDDSVAGTGNFTMRQDLVVPRIWWIKECEMVSEDMIAVVFDANYVNEDSFNGTINRPLTMPMYDRIVAPYDCRDIQGFIRSFQNNLDKNEFVVFVDKSMPDWLLFEQSDYHMDDTKVIELDQLRVNKHTNSSKSNAAGTTTTAYCKVAETGEIIYLTSEEDMNYIDNEYAQLVEDMNYTLMCVTEEDNLDFEQYLNASGANYTVEDFTDATGNLYADFAEDFVANQFNVTNDTTVRRRLGWLKDKFQQASNWVKDTGKKVVDTAKDIGKAVVDIAKGGLKLITTGTATILDKDLQKKLEVFKWQGDGKAAKQGASCEWNAEASLTFIISFDVFLEIAVLKLDIDFLIEAKLRAEGLAAASLECTIPQNQFTLSLWKKTVTGSKITLIPLGPIPIHVTPSLTMEGRVEFDSDITYFMASASAFAWAEFVIGYDTERSGKKAYSEFNHGFVWDRELNVNNDADLCDLDVDIYPEFFVNPGLRFGIAFVDGIAFEAVIKAPRLGLQLDYPAISNVCDFDTCNAKDNGMIGANLFGEITVGFRAYIPEIKVEIPIIGKEVRLIKETTLFDAKDPVVRITLFDLDYCLQNDPLSELIGDACCDYTTMEPTEEPTIPPSLGTFTLPPTGKPSEHDGVTPTTSPTTSTPAKSPTLDDDISDSYCVPKCEFEPCMCFENPSCCDCDNNSGCGKCSDGYFQLSHNHRCVSCSGRLGDACKECEDFKGCVECDSKHVLYYDEECKLWSCKPDCAD